MSRRKQAKPQHLTSDMDGLEVKDTSENGSENVPLRQVDKEDSGAETHSGAEETHVCEKCCAEFFTWSDLFEHQSGCTDNAPVLILKENEGISSQGSPTGSSSAASLHSHLADVDIRGIDRECVEMAEEPLEVSEKNHKDKIDEPMDTGLSMDQVSLVCPLPKEVEETSILFPSVLPGYGIPSTNVTLEILQSTRVAVAQFSQCVGGEGIGGRVNAAAIPVIMEQLMALQQQQVHQLQLIEQIQSQVAVMNRQPTQAALNPASKGLYAPPSPFQLQGGGVSPPVLPVSGVIPSAAHGQASLSVASTLERPPSRSSQQDGEPPKPRQKDGTSASLANPTLPLSSCSTASPRLPPYCCSLAGVSSTQTPSSHNLLPLGQASLFGQSANLPLLPQSPTSGVIFPNPLASIAATASALDPLSALIKHRKSKMPSISMFDGKSSSEDPFFKHKCRFCAKVFGSDSALQIHLRSHTGERPFKCNICGNRFSTKGNLKVHFQRHKDKYPHVQMNPYQVPEYLDNIPTSSGIPYGMSFPPEKPGTAWTESKPVLPTVPTSVSLQLPPALTCMERLCESYSKTPSGRSPQRPSPARSECASLSPDFVGTEPSKSAVLAPHQSKTEMEVSPVLATEEINLPSNCMTKAGESLASVKHHMPSDSKAKGSLQTEKTPDYIDIPVSVSNSSPPSPLLSDQSRDKFPFGGTLESMHTSETSKLQQLVENIDKNMMDPNQCVICHRVLSCQSALKMHYRIHTGERPFKCKVCGRAFTTKGNLKTHFGVHRAKPPLRVLHSCPICQRKFTNAVVLQQHIRMHMGGQIPNSAQTEVFQNKDSEIAFDEKSFDGMSNYDDDGLDDNSVGEEEANEGTGTSTPNSVSDVLPSSSGLLDSSSLTSSESQISAGDSTIDCSYALKSMRNEFMDSDYLTNDSSSIRDLDTHCVRSPAMSKLSMSGHSPLAPSYSFPLDRLSAGPNLHPKSHLEITASVKSEQSDSSAPYAENGLSSNQMGLQSLKSFVKTEISNSKMSGIKRPSDVDSSMTQSMVKMEMNGYGRPNTINDRPNSPFGFQSPTSPSEMIIPGIASLLGPPPPRRTPKQHNCNACGKNFSSASALQIHERTHTGEKPFGCSICGRAFTTKGNLKVHMGTHMWNNTPARRGRRLSVENPLTLFGGEAVKFNEMFQNDLATRAMNVDPSFWSRYVAAITNGLAMKNNEISVIQNGGVHPSSAMTMVMDKTGTGNSPQMTTHAKTNTDIGIGQHFSMLTGDSKEIGIN